VCGVGLGTKESYYFIHVSCKFSSETSTVIARAGGFNVEATIAKKIKVFGDVLIVVV
jgi:hypothetical protein